MTSPCRWFKKKIPRKVISLLLACVTAYLLFFIASHSSSLHYRHIHIHNPFHRNNNPYHSSPSSEHHPEKPSSPSKNKNLPEEASSPSENQYPIDRRSSSHQNRTNSNSNSTTSRPRLLCHLLKGRLGNQLFQYAAVLGLAKRLGRTPVFNLGPRPFLKSVFEQPPPLVSVPGSVPGLEDADVGELCGKARKMWEKRCCSFDENLMKLDPAQDYIVAKYLQSWKYFEGFEEYVRRAMTFKGSILREARSALQEALTITNTSRNDTLLIGMHVRRGDYLRIPDSSGFIAPPDEYYRKALDYMRNRFANGNGKNEKWEKGKGKEKGKSKVLFLVSVDSKKWFMENVTSSKDAFVLKRRSAPVDMALLSSLDHTIISVGTYSWWVGFLNKGVTVYWKDFIAPGTHMGNGYGDGSTFVYPGMIPL